jgi:hypothetical protein
MQNISGALGIFDDQMLSAMTSPFFYTPYEVNYVQTYSGNGGIVKFDFSRSARTAAENRSRNVSVLACIKY